MTFTEAKSIEEAPNQWRVRVKEPSLFEEGSFRTKDLGGGVSIIIGKLKNPPKGHEGSVVTQAYRFSKEKFKSKEQVNEWLANNKVGKASYYRECFILLAEEMNPFAGPEKPNTGDGKCAPGFKKDKNGRCIKKGQY